MRQIWKLPSFRWYWIGLFLSGLGDQLSWVALSWFILKKTGSSLAVGGVILAYQLPAVAASLVAGVLLDRFDRRRLIIADNILRGVIFFGIVAVLFYDLPLSLLYLLIITAGLLSPLSSSGTQTMLPRLVGKSELLTTGNALMESQWQLLTLFGPALAGILIAGYGEAVVLLFNAVSFFACAYCFTRIDSSVSPIVTQKQQTVIDFFHSLGADLKTGYFHLMKKPLIIWLAFFSFLFFAAYGPFEVALPIFANEKLTGGAVSLGFLWSAFAIGSLLGSLIFSAIHWKIPTGYTLSGIIVLWGITTFPFAVTDQLSVAMLAFGLGGMSYSPYGILYRTYLQKIVPEDLLGRVLTSIRTLTGLGLPVGAYIAGLLIPHTGLGGLFTGASMICVIVGLVSFWILKPIR